MSKPEFEEISAAFPYCVTYPSGKVFQHPGMSLRDYFAAAAMQGMVSCVRSDEDYQRCKAAAKRHGFATVSAWFASDSYKQADAMLAARERKV